MTFLPRHERNFAAGRAATVEPRLRVLIPTRNRAELAVAAALSVLEAGVPHVDVWVSDNSTKPDETERLAAELAGTGATIIRPAAPLGMADHWEWGLDRVLEDGRCTHVAVLTDRMVFQPGGLAAAVSAMLAFPWAIVSYGHDLLSDYEPPMRLEQVSWTGRRLSIPSDTLARLASRSCHWLIEPVLPRLLNSIVPLGVAAAVRTRFGSICAGTVSPDYAFGFRALTLVPSVLFLDQPVLLAYGLDRSNGTSLVYGVPSADHHDFAREMGGEITLPAAPVPGLVSVLSAVMHEYNTVRSLVPSLPAVDEDRFYRALSDDAALMRPGPMRQEVMRVLAEHGHPFSSRRPESPTQRLLRLAKDPRRTFAKVVGRATGRGTALSGVLNTPVGSREAGLAVARARPRRPRSGTSSFEREAQSEVDDPGIALA